MHRHLPPVAVTGFDHPHALTGIAVRRRPEWADQACVTCSGRGARNEILHIDSQRCRLAACADCSGVGWIAADGVRHVPVIAYVDGRPAWTTAIHDPRVVAMRPDAGAPIAANVESEDQLLEAA